MQSFSDNACYERARETKDVKPQTTVRGFALSAEQQCSRQFTKANFGSRLVSLTMMRNSRGSRKLAGRAQTAHLRIVSPCLVRQGLRVRTGEMMAKKMRC